MSEDHCDDILPGCAREFGEIKQWQESQGVLLKEVRQALIGNGNTEKSVLAKVNTHSTILKILGATIMLLATGVVAVVINHFK